MPSYIKQIRTQFVSIVIISKNDFGVRDTLEAVTSLKSKLNYEVVVVDASEGKLNDIAKSFPSVKWLTFEPLKNKRISIPEQRNSGVNSAKGNIVVFIDANCIPQDDWLDLLTEPILKENENIVAGSTIPGGSSSTVYLENRDETQKYLHECTTINLAFRKSVYESLGGFDNRFDYGSDVDFSWRALEYGYKLRFVPQARISHDWGSGSASIRRAYLYGTARARLYKKHPTRWKRLFTNDITVLVYPVFILGLPLTYWFWPYPLLIIIPFLKNINKHPLRIIQNHLVYASGVLRELVRI